MSHTPRSEPPRRRLVDRGSRAAFEPLEGRRLLASAPLPTVSIADAAVTEGDAGTKRIAFDVTLSAPAATPTKVRFTTADGTATTAGRDYVAASGWVTFPAGRTRATVSVTVRGDAAGEADETFTVALARPVGCALGRSVATGTIRDDDTPPPPETGSWTVLVYMTGDDLNPDARDDINEMERALATLPAGVRFAVSWDQPPVGTAPAYATGGGRQGAWRTYGRSVLQADTHRRKIASTFDLSFGERNSGDPATLVDFVTWGVARAPAARYVLQLWGHGGGLDGSQFDGESGYDPLTIPEIAAALAAPGMPTFDVVSYDNCLMAMAEVGAALAPRVGGTFVASQELVNASGQDYTTAYAALATADPAGVTAAQLAAGMVGSFAATHAGDPWGRDTFSATLSAGYANLTVALRTFADAAATLAAGDWTALRAAAEESIAYDTPSFRDLGSFMAGVAAADGLPAPLRTAATGVTAALTAVVASKTADQRGSSGLSIYLPTTADDRFLAAYATDAAAFCVATGWDAFVRSLVDGAAPTAVGVAASAGPRHRGPVATLAAAAWAALAGGEPASPGGRRGAAGIRRVG